ncbi:hypothetical protein [Streptomyces orinoci]|uniref:Mannose-1-phosphate guanyltransferase C-terminal domain-containing protein n=1 Tax=Streptomyces orinoci TaxID=67339 RepID=A0ABV3JVM8_STRON|nr:hypothetical protein [Streptomyces orinoci]
MNRPIEAPVIGVSSRPVDDRVKPEYYIGIDAVTDPIVRELLRSCPTVFGLKRAITELFSGGSGRGLPESAGLIEPGATVRGTVIVCEGALIQAGAFVAGPALICPRAVVGGGALVRDHCVIGPGCQIGFGAEVTRSLLAGRVLIKHTSFVGDSVLGLGVSVGAFVSTTSLRCISGPVTEPATEEITIHLDGHRIGTGQTKFGAVIGDGVVVPAGTILQPGTLVGAGTLLYPRTQIGGFFPTGCQGR